MILFATPFPAIFIFEGPSNIFFDIDTFEPIHPPWQAIRGWIPDDEDEAPDSPLELWDRSTTPAWMAPEIDLGDGRTLVLEYTLTPEATGSKRTLGTTQNPAAEKFLGKAVRKGMLDVIGISP